MRSSILVILIASATMISFNAHVKAQDSEADRLKVLTDKSASAERKQNEIAKLMEMKLSVGAQAQVATHCVGELTSESGSLKNIVQVLLVFTKFKEIPDDKKILFARSLSPLMKAKRMPNGETISLADRCGIAAAIRICDPSNTESSRFLIEQAENGQAGAYFMISACQATEAIPVLVKRLQLAEKETERYALILALTKMPPNDSTKMVIERAILKLSPQAKQMIHRQIAPTTAESTAD